MTIEQLINRLKQFPSDTQIRMNVGSTLAVQIYAVVTRYIHEEDKDSAFCRLLTENTASDKYAIVVIEN